MFKKALMAACLTTTAIAAPVVSANDDPADTRWYLSGQYSFNNPDSNRQQDGDSVGFMLGVGKYLTHSLAIEASGFLFDTDGSGGNNDQELSGYTVSALYFPMGREYGFYGLAGAGQQTNKVSGVGTIDSTIYDLGFGFMRTMGNRGNQLRGELRARFDDHGDALGAHGGADTSLDYIASIGLLRPFGDNDGSSYDFPIYDGEKDQRIYANIGASYYLADNSRGTEDDGAVGYRIGLGTFLRPNLGVELHADLVDFETAGGGATVASNSYGVDLFLYKYRNPDFSPFTVIGAGVTETETGSTTNDGNTFDLGFGFLSNITNYGLGIRFDARYRTTHMGNTSVRLHDGIINLGLNIPFGEPPSPPDDDNDGVPDSTDQCPNTPPNTPVDLDGCPLDSDNDGVIDPQDACPNTPAGTEVDARGCTVDSDSDADGVMDSIDECPGTPEGVVVGSNGCPLDDDGDGVLNAADQCPGTPAGLAVDNAGCVVQQSAVLKGVNFEFNSGTLTPHARRVLDDMAAAWKSQPDLAAVVAGHTDWMGPADFNLQLSQDRANSVKAYLVERGVPASQLTARGYGESQPIADNNTEDGRAENRRVELNVNK